MASIRPNMAYVMDAPTPGSVKACNRGLRNLMGKGFGGTPYSNSGTSQWDYGQTWRPELTYTGGGGHSYLTVGEWRSKALSVVQPHEELEPLEATHKLREIINNPNRLDTCFDLMYESQMFQELCGVSYLWIVPNEYGMPNEVWCLPSHWVWPRTGGRVPDGGLRDYNSRWRYDQSGRDATDYRVYGSQYLDPNHSSYDSLIQYYEIRPWGGMGSAGILRLPADEVIMERWKSPINKIDGYSKLSAIAQWIDSEESISKSRWSQFMNQARPEFWVELGAGYEDPDDSRIARIEAKFAAKIQGEYNYGKPVITPPGAKITPLSFNPTEMAYFQSEDQIRDMILSAFGVPKASVGIAEGMTYGSILATLASLCANCLNPRLDMRGQSLTKQLASRWDESDTLPWSNGGVGNPYSNYNTSEVEASNISNSGSNLNSSSSTSTPLVSGLPQQPTFNRTYVYRYVNGEVQRAPLSTGSRLIEGPNSNYGLYGGKGSSRKVRLWWDDCVPADPQQVNSDLAEDRNHFAITPNEVRALRGRSPYRFGGDNPMFQGPQGLMPLPINAYEDLSALATAIGTYARILVTAQQPPQQGAGGLGGGPPGGDLGALAGGGGGGGGGELGEALAGAGGGEGGEGDEGGGDLGDLAGEMAGLDLGGGAGGGEGGAEPVEAPRGGKGAAPGEGAGGPNRPRDTLPTPKIPSIERPNRRPNPKGLREEVIKAIEVGTNVVERVNSNGDSSLASTNNGHLTNGNGLLQSPQVEKGTQDYTKEGQTGHTRPEVTSASNHEQSRPTGIQYSHNSNGNGYHTPAIPSTPEGKGYIQEKSREVSEENEWEKVEDDTPKLLIEAVQEVLQEVNTGPDYQRLFWNPSTKEAWWVSFDGDEEEDVQKIVEVLASVPGVENVRAEAEGLPPRDEEDQWLEIFDQNDPQLNREKSLLTQVKKSVDELRQLLLSASRVEWGGLSDEAAIVADYVEENYPQATTASDIAKIIGLSVNLPAPQDHVWQSAEEYDLAVGCGVVEYVMWHRGESNESHVSKDLDKKDSDLVESLVNLAEEFWSKGDNHESNSLLEP